MKKRLLTMLVLLVAVAAGAWADTTVTWTASDMTDLTIDFHGGSAADNTIKGITVTASGGGMGVWQGNNISMDEGSATITFTSSVGNIKSIAITAQSFYSYGDTPSGWTSPSYTKLSWSGDASPTVSMTLSDWTEISNISEIVFTIESAPAATTYSVTLAEGTEDAANWTISPAEAAEGATVTVTYSGEKKVKSVKAVKKGGAPDPQAVPLTIEAITPGIISVSSPKEGMQYSLNGGAKTAMTEDPTEINVAVGDKVQFYGNGTSITSYSGTIITGSGNGFTCKVYGNIMSLVDEEGFATATTLSVNNTFYRLFYGNTTLTDASGLLLPATTLVENCYNQMFMGCTALTAAPALPATQLAENCYYRMFYNCGALTAARVLPATKLAADCYNQMFRICTSLTAAPELPATELANSCYRSMFMGCTALTTAPVLPATELASNCYYQMFTNCTGLTTVPSDLPATTLVEYCYYQMFSSCTALTTAPVLPATTLVDHCYYQMFTKCSKLATVTSLAESGINTESSTTNWLSNTGTQAQGTKIVYTVSSADWPAGNNGIPNGWTRVNVDN